MPSLPLDQALESIPQLLGVENFVKDERDGHVIALDERIVLEEVEWYYPVAGEGLHGGLSPEEHDHDFLFFYFVRVGSFGCFVLLMTVFFVAWTIISQGSGQDGTWPLLDGVNCQSGTSESTWIFLSFCLDSLD